MMTSSDEEIMDWFQRKQTLKRKPSHVRMKKQKVSVPEISSSDSESDCISDHLSAQEKHKIQVSDSESGNSDMDSSGYGQDLPHRDEERKGNKVRSRQTLAKRKKTNLKRKVLRQSEEELADAVETDSEPEVVKKKKIKKGWQSQGFNEEDDEYSAIKEELSQMSFEELQKLRDRLGVKVYNQVVRKGKDKRHLPSAKQKFTRENKNRPMEMSSKRPVSIYREVIPTKKKVTRDPRFDDISGTFNEAIFRSSYAFVDEIKKKEKEKLTKQLKKAKNAEKKQELKFLINRMNQQESADQQKQKMKQLEKEWKKQELSRVQEGKNPYFLKKGDLRKLELAERFKELKKTGKLEKYLGKKRKKNASKEKKKLPNS